MRKGKDIKDSLRFASMVFDEEKMKKYLPKDIFTEFLQCRNRGGELTLKIANAMASAMKNWALSLGVTHFTHWFQPMTGITAEKRESFLYPDGKGGAIMEFCGKELIKGESDASAFPSGGLRATFEARGYTAWIPTSNAFIKDKVLCIPTAFCSYNGEALDKKTPLLRSCEAINKECLKFLSLLGDKRNTVKVSIGAEQEYFLLDKKLCDKRKDLLYLNRTVFGAPPPKGQQVGEHYFGPLNQRVLDFTQEVEKSLWELGILSKINHNEVAPSQHELAPYFSDADIALDNNQITMEIMKKVASSQGLCCIFEEKPFAYVNGSGKHVNWSLRTDKGENLLECGNTPKENTRFLLTITAVISAVHKHQDLLRLSVCGWGNDKRLGSHEAPTSVISVYLGEELTGILDAIAEGREESKRAGCKIQLGVKGLPPLPVDSSDRNRTSPFAFTGNKFEFRMPGSASSIAGPILILNTIIAEEFRLLAIELEEKGKDTQSIKEIIARRVREHRAIIFNGNNYADEWKTEAKKRGLLFLESSTQCIPYYSSDKNLKLFERHGVLSKKEIIARQEILEEQYFTSLKTEGAVMLEMVKRDILPAVEGYLSLLFSNLKQSQKVNTKSEIYQGKIEEIEKLYHKISSLSKSLGQLLEKQQKGEEVNEVIDLMKNLRLSCDKLEEIMPRKLWPFPTYGDLLF